MSQGQKSQLHVWNLLQTFSRRFANMEGNNYKTPFFQKHDV